MRDECRHALREVGICGQCGKRRPLVECHVYDFRKPRAPLAKVGKQKAKREAKNREYYAGAEWRAKRKAVFERDGYQCVELITATEREWLRDYPESQSGKPLPGNRIEFRCPNRGEVVNGKQTAKGLVAEESGYQHRGIEGAIDRIKTRCKECDRRLTPRERINHANGFRPARKGT